MKRIVLLLGCLAMAPLNVQAGELYRWVDAKGKVHYGDTPSLDAKQIELRRFSTDTVLSEDLPYETRRAMHDFPVTLYVAENCGEYCKQARDLLSKRGIPFSEKRLGTKEEIDAFKALSGSDATPTLAVGRNFLKGFLESQWHSELDFAGYPKTAPYRAPKPPSPNNETASQVAPANPESENQAAPANPAVQ